MTTGPEELSLNYLLDPAFQLVNTAGRPLTNGWIEVYYHGTRDKYYCASDFDGTLHPFRIPLDSLGSNIVLADPNFSYDIYVYNSFGSLQMSRYNVNPGSGSGGGSSSEGGPAEHWSSDTAGGASTTVTGGTTVYLTLPSSEDQPEFVDHTTETAIFLKEGLYHIDAVVSFKQDEDDLQNIIKDLLVNTGLMGWDAQMTGQKNWTGPESTDDDRHFLELHTVVSVPEDYLQTLYFQISSPVDLDSAAIEKLDIIKLEAGSGGRRYAPGYGIQIEGQVISTSGMMPEASAANFVDNSTYQVDIQNIYDTIAETSAMIPSGVATEQWVTDYTSAFITSADLPDLSDYATQQWVEDKGYITSADLPDSVPLVAGEGISIVDTSASTIISIDSAYGAATHEWVEDYVSDATSAFITSADIPDVPEDLVTSAELATVSGDIVSQIPSLDGYATEQFVEDYTSAYITSGDVPVYTAGDHIDITDHEISVDGVSGVLAGEGISITASGGNYYINNLGLVPDDVVTSGELATVSGQIMNEIPDTSDMATKTWVGQQGYLTSIPDEYATSGDLVTLSGAIEADIPSYTAGDNISIVNDEISVSGTAGLIAGENINITASGDSYIISSTGGGGGGGGLDQVYHDATLTGDGTSLNPLSITSADIWNEAAGLNEYPISAGPGMSIEDVDGVTVFSCTGGEVPADVVTSGQLATVSGEIMNEIPSQTTVSIDPILQTGTKIAEFSINGTSGELFAPSGSSGGSDVFVAVYGVTTYSEIETAYNAGKCILCRGVNEDNLSTPLRTSKVAPLLERASGLFVFASFKSEDIFAYAPSQAVIWCKSDNSWSVHNNSLQANWNSTDTYAPNYIRNKPDLSVFTTSADLATVSGEIMNEIPDLTGYATETWVSNGFMETSGLEYNSQDEISGYNGHPVMTVDSEKQWLTHDDTIAHVTNSAQYAFGVNVPVVAQAMGTDETELWSGTRTSACTLSEDPTNFKAIEIYLDLGLSTRPQPILKVGPGPSIVATYGKGGANAWWTWMYLELNGTSLNMVHTKAFNFGSATSTTWSNPSISVDSSEDFNSIAKVVGIGRKENT